MAFVGFNFRSTLGYVADTQPPGYSAICTFVGAGAYSSGAGFGYISSSPTATNRSTILDTRLAGEHTLSSALFAFRIDLASGNYKFRFAAGSTGVTGPQSALVWDGGCQDGATVISTSNHTTYAATTAFALNRYTIFGANLYRNTRAGGGVTGASSPPIHTSGIVTDGSCDWLFIKAAILNLANASVTNGWKMDANSAIHTDANWPANNAQSAQVAITAGFITITKGQTSNLNIRHFAFDPQSTPLVDLVITDKFGNVVETPEILAAQPEGERTFRISASAGIANLSTISLSGPLSAYFTLTLFSGEVWATTNGIPMPDSVAAGDSAARTLSITQTDTSPEISGSPRITTFVCLVTASQAKPISGASIFALLNTEVWLAHNRVMLEFANRWPGYQGQEFATDVVVTADSALPAAVTAASLVATGSDWHRIRLRPGSWVSGGIVLNGDFMKSASGTGGLLIEPATGFDPEIDTQFTDLVLRGVHIRGLKSPGATAGGNFQWRFNDKGATGIYHVARFENNRFGLLYGTGRTSAGYTTTFPSSIVAFHGQQIDVVNNDFNGCANCLALTGVRLQDVAWNRARNCWIDYFDVGIVVSNTSTQNVFADNNIYRLMHDNIGCADIDTAFDDGQHPDVMQVSELSGHRSFPYVNGATVTSTGTNGAITNQNNLRAYTPLTLGVNAASGIGPNHTSGTAVDGTVTYQYDYTMTVTGDLYLSYYNNVFEGTRINLLGGAAAGARQVGMIHSLGRGLLTDRFRVFAAVFNNLTAAQSSYGWIIAEGEIYAQFNTAVGAAKASVNSGSLNTRIASDFNGKVFSRNNILGALPTAAPGKLSTQRDVVSSFLSASSTPPASVLTGPFTQNATNIWQFPSLETGPESNAEETKANMLRILQPLPGISAGFIDLATLISVLVEEESGFQLAAGQFRF